MNKYYTNFDGQDWETVADSKEKAKSNLVFRLNKTYRNISLTEFRNRLEVKPRNYSKVQNLNKKLIQTKLEI